MAKKISTSNSRINLVLNPDLKLQVSAICELYQTSASQVSRGLLAKWVSDNLKVIEKDPELARAYQSKLLSEKESTV